MIETDMTRSSRASQLAVLLVASWAATIPAQATEPVDISLASFHPVQASDPALKAMCAAVPEARRQQVHVFFINGCDPLGYGNLSGLCEFVQGLGFPHAQFGQMTHTRSFEQQIQGLKATDPQAKVVLVGFSFGASCARSLANRLKDAGITIDLLVYLGSAIAPTEEGAPDNVVRTVNITGRTRVFRNILVGAENRKVNARHFGLPSQPETVDTLVRELVAVAGGGPAGKAAPKNGSTTPAPQPTGTATTPGPPAGISAKPVSRVVVPTSKPSEKPLSETPLPPKGREPVRLQMK
jgi:hypothetical protein